MNREHITAQILLRSWPFPRGAGRIIDKLFLGLRFSKEQVSVKTTDGFKITVSPNDLIGRHIYLSGEFDRSIVEMLCDLAQPNDVLLDIGANIGYVSACFLANVEGSRVIAVEPQPNVAATLTQNLKQFGDRSNVVNAAISTTAGRGWMSDSPDNPGGSSLVETETSIEVTVWSADQLLSNVEKVDLVKIDVEGHEEEVITASTAHFNRLRPRAIIFECGSESVAPDGVIGSAIGKIGYKIFGIKKRLTRLDLFEIRCPSDCEFHDYVAMPVTPPSPATSGYCRSMRG